MPNSKQATAEQPAEEQHLVTVPSQGKNATVTLTRTAPAFEEDHLATLLFSPRGVMVLVPLLVFALGAALTVIGQVALGETSRKMARDRFVAHTTSVARGLENTLGQAEPLLDELARIARAVRPQEAAGNSSKDADAVSEAFHSERLAPFALETRDLLVGRPGITQVYIAYPNGAFLSADPAGSQGVGIQVTLSGRSTSYRVKGIALEVIQTRPSDYDPRARDWYKIAKEKQKRVWSAPYTFFFNQHTGITRAFPLYEDEAKTKLLAVVGVDFDVNALTAFMASSEHSHEGLNSAVFTREGIVLAYPRGAERLVALQKGKQMPTHTALGDPVLSSLIAHAHPLPHRARSDELIRFKAQNEKMFASIRRVGDGSPDWFVATFSPESSVLRDLYAHRRSSLVIGTLSLLVAMALGWVLARRLLQVRRAVSLAQAAAKEAEDQVRDLGSYRLVSKLGEGGMGEVWRASHRLLARQAAIKLIKSGSHTEERRAEQRERFRREAQAIAGLRSRHTVALFDYGLTENDTLFYVMELLDGIDLNTLVAEHGAQSPERVRQILMQACHSLAEAHKANLVHRDIKPANLFLCREADEIDVVKVLDFGLVFQAGTLVEPPLSSARDTLVRAAGLSRSDAARSDKVGDGRQEADAQPTHTTTLPTATATGRITRAEHQLGTPAFMSPEQALGSDTDGRSDLYSLACVAWWLLTADVPFQAETALALMVKHIDEPLPDISELLPTAISPELKRLIEQCLMKSPTDRAQSAEELGRALRDIGCQDEAWTEESARAWWSAHRPAIESETNRQTERPLRDAQLLPPT